MSWLLDTCVLSEYARKAPAPEVIRWLSKVEQRFAGRILPLDTAALHVWAQIAATVELAEQPLPLMDGLFMATAQCHGLTVVTRNAQDFALYPQVFNPWAL
ncbi:PIN domain-containing protein [Nitrosomonas supralitoralis]|uniref:VapC toxin family PIN domain ribonuclease n=1 Tax=Nitrosomonas supralitoralis TaxID=2116706 RepID=A0A2P7NS88_9PROT|nr:PIN domain-containing protein [Nitrosomonas supralitoralis]PSJ16309.1 VapC toxin family PIN domain ribonuclease [Nitrosomonas supralitoralis]